jgi:aryl-alcohol dehydrogenase
MNIVAAIATHPDQPFEMAEVELSDPQPEEIIVRISGVGLCHTDLIAKAGLMPFSLPAVLGHEGSGVVERVGETVRKVRPGDRVTLSFRSCGECRRCRAGEPAYCHTMPQLNYAGMREDGSSTISRNGRPVASCFFGQSSFATMAIAYERNVIKVPLDVPLELMGPLGCGIQTGAGAIMRSLSCESGSTLLVLGGGAVGLSAVMAARIQDCSEIIVVEPYAARRELALELGATVAIDPTNISDLPSEVRRSVPIGVDYALDTTGIPKILESTMQCLGPHGEFGIVGVPPVGTRAPGDLLSMITYGHSVKGIIEGDSDPDHFIPQLISLYQNGLLPFDKLVKTYRLEDINLAIEDQLNGDCIKVVLVP